MYMFFIYYDCLEKKKFRLKGSGHIEFEVATYHRVDAISFCLIISMDNWQPGCHHRRLKIQSHIWVVQNPVVFKKHHTKTEVFVTSGVRLVRLTGRIKIGNDLRNLILREEFSFWLSDQQCFPKKKTIIKWNEIFQHSTELKLNLLFFFHRMVNWTSN